MFLLRYCPSCKNDASEVIKAGEKLRANKKKQKMASANSQSSRDWGRVSLEKTIKYSQRCNADSVTLPTRANYKHACKKTILSLFASKTKSPNAANHRASCECCHP